MKKMKTMAVILAALMVIFLFAACGNTAAPPASSGGGTTDTPAAAAPSGNAPAAVKVGILNPTTGPLAGMGEGGWIDDWFKDYINNDLGGFYFADYDATLPVEFITYDTASSADKAAEMATKLITDDQVHILIPRHTPDTVVPVCVVGEQYGTPVLAMDCPGGAYQGNISDPYWSFLAHPDNYVYQRAYCGIWEEAGYTPGAPNAKVGWVFANDLDGTVLSPGFAAYALEWGWEILDPGLYSSGTNDYSSLINQFKDANLEIIYGVMNNPEFATFWTQCLQLGYKPKIVTIGKAFMLESQAMAIGADIMDGITNECWWDPRFPFKSSIMNMDGMEFKAIYEQNTGLKLASPQGAKFASMELLIDCLTRADSLEPEAIRKAQLVTNLDTIMGPIEYGETFPNYCVTPVVGAQWILNPDGTLHSELVAYGVYPEIGNTAPVKISGRAWE